MTQFDKQAAAEKLAALTLTPANRLFVNYWLSRHGDDGRFRESDLAEDTILRARRFAVSADIKPGRAAVVSAVGPGIANLLSYDLRGFDLIEALPQHLRPVRLERSAEVARGAIAHNRQRLITHLGEEFAIEEVIVPFGPLKRDGTRCCVNHLDFTPLANYPLKINERPDRPAVEVHYIDLGFTDRKRWA